MEVIAMKIRDVLKLKGQNLPGTVRSAADRTRTMLAPVQPPNRIVGLGLHDTIPDAVPDDGVTDDLAVAADLSATSPMTISPAHRRDLNFIKGQIARLPRQTDQ
jgi:hypothetical protein